ncbi:MAG TPA: 5-formyltetrahydrofolate cyclo-ligase, partial [Nevskiaceae bacterium]|nr:5-formyltetrahydrofolate cyclo-ligase [Nevskiaceae bacterium]
KGRMRFVPLTAATTVTRNRYGIAEPRAPRAPRVLPRIDVAILPLVGFDAAGHRLGSGAGYYDRWLAGLRGRRPRLVGLGFALQEVDALPAEPWDVKLDAICTERRFRYLRGR